MTIPMNQPAPGVDIRVTPTMLRALRIIQERRPDMPSAFARLMWPGHPSWNRSGKCGANGSTRGVGMRLLGGAYLAKLQKRGLVESYYKAGSIPFRLTALGQDVLSKSQDTPGSAP